MVARMTDRPNFHETAQPAGYQARAVRLGVLFVAELLVLAAAYQFHARIECHLTDAQALCEGLKSLVARALVVLAVLGVLLFAHNAARARFVGGARSGGAGWAALHLAGLALLFVPLAAAGNLGAAFGAAVLPWAAGGLAAATGGLFWLAPPPVWARLARDLGPVAAGMLVVAALIPDLATAIRPLWDWSALTTLTFRAVALLLGAFAEVSVADPARYVIGVNGFTVQISRQCSGVEGFALVVAFVAIYGVIFRRSLWLMRFALVVLPVALAASWLLNVGRIAALILIGANLSPEVAVNGFHSYAGWLFFMVLAIGLVWAVQAVPWLHRTGAAADRVVRAQDPLAVMILPFVMFMLISTAVSALAPNPDFGYPVKALALLTVVLAFLPAYLRLTWQLDPLSIAAGLGIGVLWIASAAPPDPELAGLLAAMSMASYASWLVLRLLGTVLLVPLVEEMFFRGYVLARLDGPGLWRRFLAITVSTAGFAALHGRWIEAGVAGLIFALLALRRGRFTDAVQAHVAANLLIGLVAAWRGDFSLI